jgi:syntaxin-binding protein 1
MKLNILIRIIGFLELIKTVNPTGRWKLVVVDSLSNKILNSACKMYDILEENVRCY